MGVPVDEQTLDETYTVPTVAVNRFVISTSPDTVRIAFGETRGPGSPSNWRVGLLLSAFDAYELKMVLDDLLKNFAPRYEEIVAAAKAAQEAQDGAVKSE